MTQAATDLPARIEDAAALEELMSRLDKAGYPPPW